MSVQTFSPGRFVRLTPVALRKVQELVAGQPDDTPKFRVYVTGGGCSGFSYGFKFDPVVAPDDACIKQNEVTIVVDPLSLQYLTGAEVDYRENLQGKQFFVTNPNASATCGCGNSFAI